MKCYAEKKRQTCMDFIQYCWLRLTAFVKISAIFYYLKAFKIAF